MKSIIVTGAGSGLGKELAKLFAKKDLHVLLVGRTVSKLVDVQTLITSEGGQADVLQLDVTNRTEVEDKMRHYCEQHEIYGVVNNAGIGHFGASGTVSDQQINETFQTNVLGTIYMTETILPFLEKQQAGHVINIISTAGLSGKKNESIYSASKFAVRGFTESLQNEYAESPLTFSAVYMGGMDTPFWDGTNFILDKSGLRSADVIAAKIIDKLPAEKIIVE